MATEYKAQWRDAGQTLLHAREGLKLSRKQVAEKIGYKVGTIRAWEGGFSRPSPEAIAKLNEVYGMLPLAPPASAEIPPEPTEPGGFPPDSSAAPHEPVGPSFGGGSRQDRLAMCYDFIGMGARLMIPSDDPRGQKIFDVFHKTGPEAAKSWEAWAQASPRIAAMLEKMDAPSAGLGVAVVHFSLVVQVFLIVQEGAPERAELPAESEPEPSLGYSVGVV